MVEMSSFLAGFRLHGEASIYPDVTAVLARYERLQMAEIGTAYGHSGGRELCHRQCQGNKMVAFVTFASEYNLASLRVGPVHWTRTYPVPVVPVALPCISPEDPYPYGPVPVGPVLCEHCTGPTGTGPYGYGALRFCCLKSTGPGPVGPVYFPDHAGQRFT